ncbi:MAG: diadenylate cyclase CdaA [Anaerolineae bacterium]|nr:TIGR00159 family protein [Ardenticatenia bacterium]HQZ70132.1 diadenylate cyclase CdaA [Anaerolineae bacterium]
MLHLSDLGIYLFALRATDVLDILLVALLVFALLVVVRGSTAVRLLRGILIAVLLLLLVSQVLDLPAFGLIISRLLPSAFIAIPVIFQPELRRAFERLGRAGFLGARLGRGGADWIEGVAQACRRMAEGRVGALIVIERRISLAEFADRGLPMDATCSADLLQQVFVPNSPLHDGAVILRAGRLVAARAVLPLGAAAGGLRALGTRHLAAVNISRLTDAVAIVVSEESGLISVAQDGRLTRRLTELSLAERLRATFASPEAEARTGWREGWAELRRAMGFLQPLGDGATDGEPASETKTRGFDAASRSRRRLLPRLIGRPSEFALASAVALVWWLAVQADVRPLVEQLVPAAGAASRLEVAFTGLGEDLAAYRRDDVAVQLRLRGFRDAIAAVDPSQLVALIDVPDDAGKAGDLDLAIRGRCRSRWQCWRSGVRVAESLPASLAVSVGGRSEDARSVVVEPGQALSSQLSIEGVRVSPAEVVLTGPAVQVARVSQVRAVLPVDRLEMGMHSLPAVSVVAVDAFGSPVLDITVRPERVRVDLVVVQRGEPVAVAPRWRIAPADGYEIYDIKVQPNSVQLEGPDEAIEAVRQRGFKPLVDLTGLTEDTVKRFDLDLPATLRALGGVDGITVTLRVRPQTGTRNLELTLRPVHLAAGLRASLAATTVQVVLEGPRPALDALSADQVKAEVDLRGLPVGTHQVRPNLDLPSGISVRSLAPESVEVTLEAEAGVGTTPAATAPRSP